MMDPKTAAKIAELLAGIREIDQHEQARRKRLMQALSVAAEGLATAARAGTLGEAQEAAYAALRECGTIMQEPGEAS